MTCRFHPDAEEEHLDAIAYYELRRAGLGVRYLVEFERVLERICETPNRYPVAHPPDIRRARLQRFPFAILHRRAKAYVDILAVAHDRRRPAYWIERL